MITERSLLDPYLNQSIRETGHCPNCGTLKYRDQLNQQSIKVITGESYKYVSTLYGVCEICVKNHRR